jgi:hypothetical protein
MSDKPIHAEVVRADQIRVGDRIILWGSVFKTVSVTVIECVVITECIEDDGVIRVSRHSPKSFVARILPMPVEVREFWRAVHDDIDGEVFGKPCDDREGALADAESTRNGDCAIEHVRETILSREEVQP